jgi:hypothetical protein
MIPHNTELFIVITIISLHLKVKSRSVFLNRRAADQYRALASIIPGPCFIKKEITWPRSDKVENHWSELWDGPLNQCFSTAGPWYQIHRALVL